MCSHFGYEVIKLKRIRIMDISLKNLPVGKWRNLTNEEIKSLLAAKKADKKNDK